MIPLYTTAGRQRSETPTAAPACGLAPSRLQAQAPGFMLSMTSPLAHAHLSRLCVRHPDPAEEAARAYDAAARAIRGVNARTNFPYDANEPQPVTALHFLSCLTRLRC